MVAKYTEISRYDRSSFSIPISNMCRRCVHVSIHGIIHLPQLLEVSEEEQSIDHSVFTKSQEVILLKDITEAIVTIKKGNMIKFP